MSFSFGFSGDDVGDDNEMVTENENISANAGPESQFVGLPAEEHNLQDLVGIHARLLSFSFHELAGADLAVSAHSMLAYRVNISFVLVALSTKKLTEHRKKDFYLRDDA
jgi:hypothetical protein